MSDDDLVKRLRDLGDHAAFEPHMHHTAADRIKKLEAENKLLSEGATIAHFQGVVYARNNMADAIWNEFKDKWDGERKYALRQIVRWLKNEKAPGDEAEGQ